MSQGRRRILIGIALSILTVSLAPVAGTQAAVLAGSNSPMHS
mgnify:CR=1 FL=1